jgi:hypothetical protein
MIWAPAGALDHPNLFFSAAEIEGLRQRAAQARANPEDFYADNWDELLFDCRSTYGPGKTAPNPAVWRNYQAIVTHAMLLLLDPTTASEDRYQSDQRFFDFYFANLNDSRWSNFFGNDRVNAPWVLEALCIGYDWHYDKFTPAQRTDIVNKIAARCDYILAHHDTFLAIPPDLEPIETYYFNTFKVLTNRGRIPIAPLALAAYVLEGEVDESRRQAWLAAVEENYNLWNTYVAADGTSHEGYGYHEHLIGRWGPMIHARWKRTGSNLYKESSYLYNEPIVSAYCSVPGGDRFFLQSIPYADLIPDPPAEVRTGDALAAAMLKDDPTGRDQLANWLSYMPLNGEANNNYSRQDPTQFIWADATIPMKSPQELGLPFFHYFPDRGIFVWRSGWDNMATYFTTICGPVIGGHQHPENGGFTIFKGGTPFIAHQSYTLSQRTEHHNVLMIGGQGQFGDRYEDGTATMQPLPPDQWPSIEQVVADDLYFNVLCELTPNYRETKLQAYQREFLGVDGFIFVRDRIKASSPVQVDAYMHAYATQHPGTPPDQYEALNIDSMPTVNPWSGSGRAYSVKPREADNGPFAEAMTVLDLSRANWTGAVSEAIVNNVEDQWVRRGNKLVRSRSLADDSLLMACYFPDGANVAAWPDSAQAEGTLIARDGSDRVLIAWPSDGTMDDSHGMTVHGAMGGVNLDSGEYWGRDVTLLAHQGTNYIVSDRPISAYGAGINRLRLLAAETANVSLRHPEAASEVYLDFQAVPSDQWSWQNGTLTVQVPGSTAQKILTTTIGPTIGRQDVIDYLLGNADYSADLDLNGDGRVDVGDIIQAGE